MKHQSRAQNKMAMLLRRADGTVDIAAYEAIARRERAHFLKSGWSTLRSLFLKTRPVISAMGPISGNPHPTAR
jgi:hypothetical protein